MIINDLKKLTFLLLLAVTFTFTSCDKEDELPKIGGYNNADEIASSNLIAYWAFNGNTTEAKNNLVATNSGVTFAQGIKGQAYKGSGASNLHIANAGTAFASLQSFTMSTWINEPAQPINNTTPAYIAGQGAQGMFFMYDNSDWNLLHLNLEPHGSADSLRIHAGFNNTGAPEYKGIVPEGFFGTSINKWVHLVMRYDGSTSTYTLFKNGVPVEVGSAWGTSAATTVWTNGDKTTKMGNISYKNAPVGIVIGSFPQAVTPTINASIGAPQPWSGNYQGLMDELRIYNKSLSDTDVSSLYALELAGR